MFLNVYFERDREHEQGRGREREIQTPKQPPGSEMSAQCPTRNLNSQTVRPSSELKSDANGLSHPGALLR